MVSRKKTESEYNSPTLEEQQECEEYLRTMATSLGLSEDFCSNMTQYGNSKKNKNGKKKSKKSKSKEVARSVDRGAAVFSLDADADDSFQVDKAGKSNKKSNRHKDRREKQKKKVKLESEECSLCPRFLTQRKDGVNQSFGGLDETDVASECKNQNMDTSACQEMSHAESEKESLLKSQLPILKEVYFWKEQPEKAEIHQKKVAKVDAPLKKRVVFNTLPCVLEHGCTQVKKWKDAEAAKATALVPGSKAELPKSSPVFQNEDNAHNPQRENGCKMSQELGDNYNSQDLFITQKTFLATDDSSGESIGTASASVEPRHKTPHKVKVEPPQELLLARSSAEKATQTNDFFSSPALSTFFEFCERRRQQKCTEQPVDLSLPKRDWTEMNSDSPCIPVKEEEMARCHDPKTSNTVSNEGSNVLTQSKADISQMKMVQTQLNESFFFKIKGERKSPKTRSPLMKFSLLERKGKR